MPHLVTRSKREDVIFASGSHPCLRRQSAHHLARRCALIHAHPSIGRAVVQVLDWVAEEGRRP